MSLNQTARVDVADVLRGLSVVGILLLHSIEHFNFYSFPDTTDQSVFLNFTDKAIWNSAFFIFGSKAYAIFAMLFGFSFFVQDNNQRLKGCDFRGRFMWRLVLLFVIGNINAMFFTGEILVMYSLVGFVLVAVYRLPDKVLLAIAIVLLLQPLEWPKIIMSLTDPQDTVAKGLSGYYFKQAFVVQSNGSFIETVKMNLWDGQMASLMWSWENGRVLQTAALFILGMLVGRHGLFVGSERNLKTWFKIMIIGLVAYFPLTGVMPLLKTFVDNAQAVKSINMVLQSLANFSFMLVLISGVILVFYTTTLQKTLIKITPYGRMSLTNYITQSIIGSMLFYNWGFGLHSKLGITYSFVVGVGLCLLQIIFCRWWMNHHKQGPLEYLWKKATWIDVKCGR